VVEKTVLPIISGNKRENVREYRKLYSEEIKELKHRQIVFSSSQERKTI
jgi:hypothetical protein